MVSYKMGNLYKKKKIHYSLLVKKKGKNPYKRAPKAMGLGFCTRHQVKNNENEIWSKWSLIKWEIFIRLFFFNYSILGKKGKIPQKTSPEGDSCFWGVPYWQQPPVGQKKSNFYLSTGCRSKRDQLFSEEKNISIIITFLCKRK